MRFLLFLCGLSGMLLLHSGFSNMRHPETFMGLLIVFATTLLLLVITNNADPILLWMVNNARTN